MKKITHLLLQDWLFLSHAAAKRHLAPTSPSWPVTSSPQSDWTLWAHYTFARAIVDLYQPQHAATMSLRVSKTKKDPTFWTRLVNSGFIHDHAAKQMGLDFCLMGPTGARVHHLTAESECHAQDSVSIRLSEEGYIWDWSKLLGNLSAYRLFFAVVGGNTKLASTHADHPTQRRVDLCANMTQFFKGTHGNIHHRSGIGGYILAHHHGERADSYTFVVQQGKISFQKIPATLTLL
ncbi:hypothetical protein [Ralstonia sp. 24A2]|uniref:hypothetical protein n=1 Tax=Ralstonia sp. 24A2 TaxID=3447364 RepID=UPI003F69AB3B